MKIARRMYGEKRENEMKELEGYEEGEEGWIDSWD
jgi:hypothetical protein